jgi:hypothetical protein
LKPGLFIGWLAAAALATGCATSSIQQRKTERREAYEGLAADARAGVDRGEIREGLDTNAVYIAWGKPTRVEHTTTAADEEICWEYWRNWTRVHPHWSYEPGPNGCYFTVEYRPTTSSWKYESAWVVFRSGHVIRWGRFPPPSYQF